jgi:hypothetical protein
VRLQYVRRENTAGKALIDPVFWFSRCTVGKTKNLAREKERLPAIVGEASLDTISISAANDFAIAPAGP